MELRVEINDHGLQAAMQRAPHRVTQHIEAALMRGAQEVARDARRRVPKAFSTLTQSIRAQRVSELHYRVSTGTNYARSVEEGRRPGVQPGTGNGLREWVKFRFRLDGTELERATFAIARSIARRGIRPVPYMQPALDDNRSRLAQLINDAAAKGIVEALRG